MNMTKTQVLLEVGNLEKLPLIKQWRDSRLVSQKT